MEDIIITITRNDQGNLKIQIEELSESHHTVSVYKEDHASAFNEPKSETKSIHYNSQKPGGKKKPVIKIHGVRYRSVRHAASCLGISVGNVWQKLQTGYPGFKKVNE